MPKKKTAAKTSAASPKKTASAAEATGRGDKRKRVLKLAAKHPEWSKKQIATAAKCTPNYVYSILGGHGQTSGKTTTSTAGNGAVTAFYKAVKSVGGVPKAKELLANIEAFQNA